MNDKTILQLLREFVVGADIENLISTENTTENSSRPVTFDPQFVGTSKDDGLFFQIPLEPVMRPVPAIGPKK